jgi:HlyD family secretion protein
LDDEKAALRAGRTDGEELMAEGSPFRKESLERLSSPERLDQLLRVVERKSWLPLLTAAILLAILVGWSIFGRIPVNAHGRGILVRPREIVELRAPGDGYLSALKVGVGDAVESNAVLGLISRPDLEQELALQRAKEKELAALISPADPSGDSIDRHIQSARELAEKLKKEGMEAVTEERQRLLEQKKLAGMLCDSLKARLDARSQLHQQGIIAREEIIDSEVEWTNSLARLSEIEADLWELRTKELEIEDQYLNRLERITDREQHYAEVSREISRLLALLEEEGRIVSDSSGRILEISAAVGEFLEQGDRIGSMAVKAADDPFVSLVYFTVKDGKRMRPGMAIQVTPDPVERARYGSMLGTVTSISPYPVTLAEAEKVVGNREIAEALVSNGYRIQVFAELQSDPSTFSRFRWSSSKGPRLEITAGTTTTARVAVDRRAPITFVLPILKASVGVD